MKAMLISVCERSIVTEKCPSVEAARWKMMKELKIEFEKDAESFDQDWETILQKNPIRFSCDRFYYNETSAWSNIDEDALCDWKIEEIPEGKKFKVQETVWNPSQNDLERFIVDECATVKEAVKKIQEEADQRIRSLNNLDTPFPLPLEPIFNDKREIVGYDYPFRADYKDVGPICLIRLWDGAGVKCVSAFDIIEE